jgi:ADP-heptose:LPS heptosyltransferase
MNKKAKFSGRARRVFFNLMGASRSRAFLSYVFRKRFKQSYFSFPVNVSSIKEILIIVPKQHLEILYQLKNLLSIASVFKNSAITVFCSESTSSYVKMIPDISIVEYHEEEQSGFITQFLEFLPQFKNRFDICILLDRTPELSILSLIGSTNAPIRAGYDEAGGYPFLNLKARASSSNLYLQDKNCVMAELFGMQSESLRMSVARKTLEEMNHLLKEIHISNEHGLVGIDALFFLERFGEQWFEGFLNRLHQNCNCSFYLYIDKEPSSQQLSWLKNRRITSITELSASKIAALVHLSDLVIAGNTIFYGLAAVLNKAAVGFFREDEMDMYCPSTNKLKGYPYKDTPDEQSIIKIIDLIVKVAVKKNKVTL